jgi:hypothetical protein
MSNAMVKFYASRVLRGRMTLEEVPEKYQEQVKQYLESL